MNASPRNNASAALFAVLRELGIQAALTHKAALALHRSRNAQNIPQEIKVVVKLEGTLTIEGLCSSVVSRPSIGYQFTRKQSRLLLISANSQAEGKPCRVTFVESTILDFNEIVLIAGIPVLPTHAILLQELSYRSRSTVSRGKPPGKELAKFFLECLLASGSTPLNQLSPLWQSAEILAEIARHIQALPDATQHWISRGIDLSVSSGTLPASSSPPQAQVGASESVNDDDNCEATLPDPEPLEPERPSAVGKDGRSPVTDIVAAEVVYILKQLGLECAILDSAASYLYSEGQSMAPEILIVIVLPPLSSPPDGASLMEQIYREDPIQFDWDSEIGKLFYRFRPGVVLPPLFQRSGKKCLVELLLSGSGGLPLILPSDITWIEDLPVVPFLSLLLAKLEKWANYPKRANADELQLLLMLVPDLPVSLFRPWREREFMSEEFQATTEVRAKKFSQSFPDTEPIWQTLGFLKLPPSLLSEHANVTIPGPNHAHSPVTDVAARRVASILEELGFACALSGSAAFQLYSRGETRVSEWLDIIVLPPHSFPHNEAWLKEQIVQKDPSQFKRNLVRGTLLFNFPPDLVLPRSFQIKNNRTCTVELILPGTPAVPRLAASDIVWIDDLPVIPFLTTLLLLLEKWDNLHYKRDNNRDLKRLLTLVPNLPVSVFRPWSERRSMSITYQAKSEVRAANFAESTLTKPIWKMLGFEVKP